MIVPSENTLRGLETAITEAARTHQAVELRGVYPITDTLQYRDQGSPVDPRPTWFAGMKLCAGGPMWDHSLGADWFNSGVGAIKWDGADGGTLVEAEVIYGVFDGVSFFGGNRHTTGVQISFSQGWGSGKNVFSRCLFADLDSAVSCGSQLYDGNCDLSRFYSCLFQNCGTALTLNNWQSYGHVLRDSVLTNVDTVVKINYGGRVHIQNICVGFVDTIFRVNQTTEQLDTFRLSGLDVDYDGEPPTLLDVQKNVCGQPLHLIVDGVHTTKPNTKNAVIKTEHTVFATLRSIRKLGRLCEGSGRARIVIEQCEIAPGAWPKCPLGWGSGVVYYDNGVYRILHWLQVS